MTGDEPVRCAHCGRRFADEDLRALHEGQVHTEALTGAQRDRYRAALEREDAALRRYRLRALAVVVVLYFLFLFAYAIVG